MPISDPMANVSKPLIALLVATVAMAALWMVALKPSTSRSGGSGGSGAYQSAISKAHQAVATSNAASAAHGGTVGTVSSSPTPTAPAAASASSAPASKPVSTATSRATASDRQNRVTAALRSHKVLALLFYNPAASDDRAVKQELATVPAHRGRVVKLAIPVTELARYQVVTNQVPISTSPTLVLIDRRQQASTILGFADRFEIAQRVADSLAAK